MKLFAILFAFNMLVAGIICMIDRLLEHDAHDGKEEHKKSSTKKIYSSDQTLVSRVILHKMPRCRPILQFSEFSVNESIRFANYLGCFCTESELNSADRMLSTFNYRAKADPSSRWLLLLGTTNSQLKKDFSLLKGIK